MSLIFSSSSSLCYVEEQQRRATHQRSSYWPHSPRHVVRHRLAGRRDLSSNLVGGAQDSSIPHVETTAREHHNDIGDSCSPPKPQDISEGHSAQGNSRANILLSKTGNEPMNAVSRALARRRELEWFCGRLGEFCMNPGKFALLHK